MAIEIGNLNQINMATKIYLACSFGASSFGCIGREEQGQQQAAREEMGWQQAAGTSGGVQIGLDAAASSRHSGQAGGSGW